MDKSFKAIIQVMDEYTIQVIPLDAESLRIDYETRDKVGRWGVEGKEPTGIVQVCIRGQLLPKESKLEELTEQMFKQHEKKTVVLPLILWNVVLECLSVPSDYLSSRTYDDIEITKACINEQLHRDKGEE